MENTGYTWYLIGVADKVSVDTVDEVSPVSAISATPIRYQVYGVILRLTTNKDDRMIGCTISDKNCYQLSIRILIDKLEFWLSINY